MLWNTPCSSSVHVPVRPKGNIASQCARRQRQTPPPNTEARLAKRDQRPPMHPATPLSFPRGTTSAQQNVTQNLPKKYPQAHAWRQTHTPATAAPRPPIAYPRPAWASPTRPPSPRRVTRRRRRCRPCRRRPGPCRRPNHHLATGSAGPGPASAGTAPSTTTKARRRHETAVGRC